MSNLFAILFVAVVLFVLMVAAIVVLLYIADKKKIKQRIDVKNQKSEEEAEDIESKIDI